MALIEVEDLRYRYPGREELALDHVSFTVEEGELVGIVGSNLSGKSTLCAALVGLVPHFYKGAYGGTVTVAGKRVRDHSVGEMSRTVGLVFENPFTQITGSKLTVYEEVAFGLEYAGVSREEMIPRIDHALELLGLSELRNRMPFALSGGQMQRLAIASVLAMRPEILVLDEPTSQLDPAGTSEVFEAIGELRKEGITVLIAEHKVERIAAAADRVIALQGGKLVASGTPAKLFGREDLHERGVATPAVVQVAKAWGLTDGAGELPLSVSQATALLERGSADG
ncbi:MAG: energy-coupling factor ABC transporter ATP-binding protein [Alkalispirochaetaceae bacterium]